MSLSKTDILAVAATLFHDQSYHGTTMRQIAHACEVTGAGLYAHITSKEEILWEIVNRTGHRFLSQARAVPQTLAVTEQLRLLTNGHLAVLAHHPQDVTVFFNEWRALTPER